MSNLPAYFLFHGGGPWPYMKAENGGVFDQLEASLIGMRRELGEQPRAVLMVSAHWEEAEFTVSSAERPGMVYDYFGFPEYTYHVSYGAPGAPQLAAEVEERLRAGGLGARRDAARGFDHGTFGLMQPLYPEATMPVVQLSLKAGLDPASHLEAGRLLAPLRADGVLIVGSGASYHNLRRLDRSAAEPSRRFDQWLGETLTETSPDERARRLEQWRLAPAAREAHPREEHLIPLMTVVGAAEDERGARTFHQSDFAGAVTMSSFRFGDAPAAG